jgi:uncharacterized protein (DUF1330 family)
MPEEQMQRDLIALTVVLALSALALGAQTPKKAYVIVQVDVMNAQQYGEYTKLSPGIIEKFGGRFVARGGRAVTLEGPPARSRVVVVEFPSFERAQEFYNSPEYQAAKRVRDGAATAQFVLVEGM